MFKMRGRVIAQRIETIESKKGETFKKMLVNIQETDTGFDHVHQFEIFGENAIDMHKEYIIDERYVVIEFYVKSNEWKDKFFNTLNIKNVLLEDAISIKDDVPFA